MRYDYKLILWPIGLSNASSFFLLICCFRFIFVFFFRLAIGHSAVQYTYTLHGDENTFSGNRSKWGWRERKKNNKIKLIKCLQSTTWISVASSPSFVVHFSVFLQSHRIASHSLGWALRYLIYSWKWNKNWNRFFNTLFQMTAADDKGVCEWE